MMIFSKFLIIILMTSSVFAFTKINQKTILEDSRKGNMQQYKYDNLPRITTSSLISRDIITSESDLTRDIPEDLNKTNIRNNLSCSFVEEEWTSTIYNINPEQGVVTCMVSRKGDLYNPIGTFETYYPNLKKSFGLNLKQAEIDNKTVIANADKQFEPLQNRINDIYQSTTIQSQKEFLTIPQLITAAVLTDTDIIDIEATRSTNKLQLKDSYISKYFDSSSGEFVDNKEYILADTETIFKVYAGLSDVSMVYLILLIAFFAIWGVGSKILSHTSSRAEGKQNHEKVSPYTTGLIMGILLFFPSGYGDEITGSNGAAVPGYDIMKTKYQEFEKDGYTLFTAWADEAAKVIIDAEIDAIIKKSGVATKDQIIQASAGEVKYDKLSKFTNEIWSICRDDIYNYNGLVDSDKKHQYSEDPNMAFPVNEKWAYANSKINGNTSVLYYSKKDGEVKSENSYHSRVLQKVNASNPLDNYYPDYSLSACGKTYYNHLSNVGKLKDNKSAKEQLFGSGTNSSNKIPMLEGLVKFQYELYRDWGYLAVLGLPVTKLQTEYIGGLYKTRRNEVLEKLNDEVKQDSMGTHMIMSSIPYMFVPGAGTIFQAVNENSGKIGAIIGGTSGAVAGGGLFSWLTGSVGSVVGAATGTVGGGALALYAAYKTSKTLLELTPIVGIVMIGLLRFVIIIIKIFSFHFASLFMMPIMFARENIQAIAKFTMKVFSTMLELPIFVLSVWLAITASSLIHTIGDVFGKKIILGMLENNSLQNGSFSVDNLTMGWLSKLKIYMFDGFMEITVAVFSIVIIYKIIISLHNTLFEIIDVQGSKELDNAMEGMKNESSSWGNRM